MHLQVRKYIQLWTEIFSQEADLTGEKTFHQNGDVSSHTGGGEGFGVLNPAAFNITGKTHKALYHIPQPCSAQILVSC